MGMTIDEHKEHLLDIMDSMPDDVGGDWRDSLAYAVETMRKYQKIEQIVKVWHQDIYAKDFECMAEIAEVVEDGNDKRRKDTESLLL